MVHRELHGLTHSFPPRRFSDRRPLSRRKHQSRRNLSFVAPDPGQGFLKEGAHGRQRGPNVFVEPPDRDMLLHRLAVVRTLGKKVREQIAPDLLLDRSRSEEHTSELQSLMRISYDVFCLKKKNTPHTKHDFDTKNHYNTFYKQSATNT